MNTFTYTETYTVVRCGHQDCDIKFGMPDHFYNKRIKDHKNWYCPNGHIRHFASESEEEALRRQLAEKERMLNVNRTMLADARRENETLIRSRRSIQAHAKQMKVRAAAGVCPAGCKRHFANLQRHIATKHPTWKHEETK